MTFKNTENAPDDPHPKSLAEHVKRVVDAMPPLTDDQLSKLVVLLRPEPAPVAHVPIATRETSSVALPGQQCGRCGRQVKGPFYDSDLNHVPLCYLRCRRPCEGYSAFCHECQCGGEVERAFPRGKYGTPIHKEVSTDAEHE